MSKTKSIGKQLLAFLLAFITLMSVIPIMPVSAETLSDGKSKTVTIELNETHYILETEGGTKLQGQSWTYTSDTGITGPAYCVNWGLDIPNPKTQMTITGRYTASPKTIGAFAGGYPQRTLEDFISINKAKHPIIANLTREEYLSATQAAVWATLGQLAIEGTEFTSGRDTLKVPTDNPSQLRAYEALMIILYNASFWDRPLLAGMHIRLGRQEAGNVLDIEDANGLIGAEQNGMYGIEKETIDGTEYYTRTFVASSATSTYKNGHTIHMYLENAPTGTILTDLSNNKLETFTSGGKKYWKIPTPSNALTNMNENGQEYANDFKVCIPVRNTPEKGNIIFHASAIITQYDIYFANNTVAREQSFVIADPMYAPMSCTGQMKWAKVTSPYGRLIVNKTDSMGNALAGAIFTLTGSDGSSYTGTSNKDGQIIWEYLNPEATYVLSETQAPDGYFKTENIPVNVLAGTTTTVSVKNYSERALRIYKVDAQNGSPLIGATFRIEQTDGSYMTDVTTGHSGCIEFVGDELPFGSYKIYEISAPAGYHASEDIETFRWDGREDVILHSMCGANVDYVVTHIDRESGFAIASRKLALEKIRIANARRRYTPGRIVDVKVLSVGRGVCTVTYNGFDVVLPQREISYSAVPDLRETLHPGEIKKAMIKEYNKDEGVLKLSIKETTPHPFDGIETRHPIGCTRIAKIVGKYKGGIFCRLYDGVTDVLCSYYPTQYDGDFKVGDSVELYINKYNTEKKLVYGRILRKMARR